MSVGSMSWPSSQSDNRDADSAGLFGRLPVKLMFGKSLGLNLNRGGRKFSREHQSHAVELG